MPGALELRTSCFDGRMKVVDMKIDSIREAVLFRTQSAADLYRSSIAVDCDSKKPRHA